MNHAELTAATFIVWPDGKVLDNHLEDGEWKPNVVFNQDSVNETWFVALQSMPTLYQALTQNYNAISILIELCEKFHSALDKAELIATITPVLNGMQDGIMLAQSVAQLGGDAIVKQIRASQAADSIRNHREEPPP